MFHFLGEVEAVFGIWAVALVIAIIGFYDWKTVVNYIGYKVNFTEALFVVVIMTLAATRPILRLADAIIRKIANLMGGTLTARWLATLTIGPILGSFITEPAAMTISALVLARIFYELEPSQKFKYATLGLLFVNISVGGTLTHFAAPPVLMVASPWEWSRAYAEINDFEAQLVEFGIVLLKYWLHITPEEQLKRFQARQETPWKRWKLTEEDWRNREQWNEYKQAVKTMVEHTSTGHAPWSLIPANDKLFARIEVLKTVCQRLKQSLKNKSKQKK